MWVGVLFVVKLKGLIMILGILFCSFFGLYRGEVVWLGEEEGSLEEGG